MIDNDDIAPKYARIPMADLVAIRGYTGGDFFVEMNKALRDGDPAALAKYDGHINALSSGLSQLDPYRGMVTRGISIGPESMESFLDRYKPGSDVTEPHFVSSGVNNDFMGNVTFTIESNNGRMVKFASHNPKENEVIFPAGSTFRVVSQQRSGPFGHHIRMKEIVTSRDTSSAPPDVTGGTTGRGQEPVLAPPSARGQTGHPASGSSPAHGSNDGEHFTGLAGLDGNSTSAPHGEAPPHTSDSAASPVPVDRPTDSSPAPVTTTPQGDRPSTNTGDTSTAPPDARTTSEPSAPAVNTTPAHTPPHDTTTRGTTESPAPNVRTESGPDLVRTDSPDTSTHTADETGVVEQQPPTSHTQANDSVSDGSASNTTPVHDETNTRADTPVRQPDSTVGQPTDERHPGEQQPDEVSSTPHTGNGSGADDRSSNSAAPSNVSLESREPGNHSDTAANDRNGDHTSSNGASTGDPARRPVDQPNLETTAPRHSDSTGDPHDAPHTRTTRHANPRQYRLANSPRRPRSHPRPATVATETRTHGMCPPPTRTRTGIPPLRPTTTPQPRTSTPRHPTARASNESLTEIPKTIVGANSLTPCTNTNRRSRTTPRQSTS